MKNRLQIISLVSVALLSACGGGGSGGGPNNSADNTGNNNMNTSNYTVNTNVGTGGSIDPDVTVLAENESETFTISADNGFEINDVSGCNGVLSANLYTIGPVMADCEVTVSFIRNGVGNTPVYSQRLSRIIADYDNNGQQDAVRELEYDAQGRIVRDTYSYLGDGTEDRLNLDEPDALQVTIDFEYDQQGRLILWDRSIVFIDPASIEPGRVARTVMENVYSADGTVDQFISSAYNQSGQLLPLQPLVFQAEYHGDRISHFSNSTSTLGVDITTTTTLTYGVNGLPETATANTPEVTGLVAGQPFILPEMNTFHDFQWNNELQNTGYQFSYPLDINNPDVIDGYLRSESIFNAQGLLVSQEWTSDEQADKSIWTLDSFLFFVYDPQTNSPIETRWDLNRNGSVDATLSYEWETDDCVPSFFWAPLSLIPNNLRGFLPADIPIASFLPGTGANYFDVCAQ